MPQSLSSKLRALRRTLKSKLKTVLIIDVDHIKLIARHMPRTTAELVVLIPSSFVSAYGDKILELTLDHGRDQDAFDECVIEIGSFVRGGLPGMDRLNKVYTQILKHYSMEDESEEILDACYLYVHPHQKRLVYKRESSDEPSDTFVFSGNSQSRF